MEDWKNLFATRTILKKLDTEIFEALSGYEALPLLLCHEFALALLDVYMPDMDGFELAELMRSNKDTMQIPIIFVTAISKQLVEVMGGEIWAESKHGKGSTFHFSVNMESSDSIDLIPESECLYESKPSNSNISLLKGTDSEKESRTWEDCREHKKTSEETQKGKHGEALGKMFEDLLNSFEEFNPSAVEPFLEKLGQHLPLHQLDPIVHEVDRFDFDRAKEKTVKLARASGFKL